MLVWRLDEEDRVTWANAAYLRGRTGKEPGAGDLYAAHFLGPAGAADLMQAMDRNPGGSAAALFPEAASANRSIFYRNGRPAIRWFGPA